ncbi:MAG: hypothetical protein PHR16_02520 [Methylovulum sp.]|nr:hypothetical protein [Methylovulum sp.]
MARLFSWLTAFVISMILMAGLGVYWQSHSNVEKAQQAAATAIAKSAATSVSIKIDLFNKTLDKMAQDPEVLTAITIANPAMLATVASTLEKHLPGILKIRLLLPGVNDVDDKNLPPMGFADLDMVRETFTKNQPPAIQGEKQDRHLAIARQITQNNQPVGVILASLDYQFIDSSLATAATSDTYLELDQEKSVLASAGKKGDPDQLESNQVNVAGTNWTLHYQSKASASIIDFSMFANILIPALFASLSFFVGYRKLVDILSQDLNTLIKAFKDMITGTLQGNYAFQLSELSAVMSSLLQFKRVIDKGDYETISSEHEDFGANLDTNIIVSDDEDFSLDSFFDDDSDFKL